MIISNNNLGASDVREQITGNQLALFIIIVRVARQNHTKSIANRDTWRYHDKTASENLAARMTHGIDGLPGDKHCNHRGLAGASSEL